MKVKLIIVAIILALPLFLFSVPPEKGNVVKSEAGEKSVSDTTIVQSGKNSPAAVEVATKPRMQDSQVNSIYYIDIKENRTINNYFTRHFFTTYTNKNLRSALLEKGSSMPAPMARLYTRIIEKAFRYPFVIFFLAIIVLLIINVLTVIVILFITNLLMNIRSRKSEKLRDIYEKILTDLMLQVVDTKEATAQLEAIKVKKNNDLLIEVMMDFQRSFRGDSDRQILDLYENMGLSKVSYDKTFSVSFYRQVLGIRELANMHPVQAAEMIASRLNDSNDIVRTEAQICYPYANTEFPFEFLGILEKPFSKWAQLNIYYYIKIHELPVPNFENWLKSEHTSVVNFCILMIALFQQRESSAAIIGLLQNPNESTRYEAIKTCNELGLFESKQVMKDSFHGETVKNQLEIIKSFKNIGDDTDLPFLEVILQSEEKSLRMETCRTIYNLGEKAKIYLEELNQSMNFILSTYIAHIKDTRN